MNPSVGISSATRWCGPWRSSAGTTSLARWVGGEGLVLVCALRLAGSACGALWLRRVAAVGGQGAGGQVVQPYGRVPFS